VHRLLVGRGADVVTTCRLVCYLWGITYFVNQKYSKMGCNCGKNKSSSTRIKSASTKANNVQPALVATNTSSGKIKVRLVKKG
jgi:hypothetical protein